MNDMEARALNAGLVYIQDFSVGYRRQKCGKGFKYLSPDGRVVSCKETRQRVADLVIPPAWKNVWICLDADGHIQATGFDDAGRKQYLYHPQWHEASAAHKYGRLKTFAGYLPAIRRRVQSDLRTDGLQKARVVAAVVRLMDKVSVRVGNKQYLVANDSRGATTLSAEHVSRSRDGISFNFKGKSGKQVEVRCVDDDLAAVIEDCESSGAEFLFSYRNENGDCVPVNSSDVNSYLFAITGATITAKDFRTWRGSVLALTKLASMAEDLSKTAKKRFIVASIKEVAAALNNTPAVCRGSYIHSAILSHAEENLLPALMRELSPEKKRRTGLNQNEIRLVAFLAHIEEQDRIEGPPNRLIAYRVAGLSNL